MFESTVQRISDQARAIRRNGWLSELELEAIRRNIEQEGEEGHEMENVTWAVDMGHDEVGVVDGGLVNEQNVVDFEVNVNETDVDIPPEERGQLWTKLKTS